jgi:flagellar hook-associated protein 1 FlgK
MATSILGIGQSALAAAQAGLSTTGHNIANASTAGYSRQVVIQGAATAQNFGFGFLGQGTQVTSVQRVYSDFLGNQAQSAQSSASSLDSYNTQISQIDNILSDPSAGLAPAIQDFFNGVQTVATNPASIPARQAALSSGDALAARFNSLGGQLDEIAQGVNSQIASSVSAINSYAIQLAQLNTAIGNAQRSSGQPPNDLLDQRDQLVLDLNKEVKATVVKQGDGNYNVFIGNGQPLVVGSATFKLSMAVSATDPGKLGLAYQNANGSIVALADTSISGGTLGGLIDFRNTALQSAQNSLGQLAIGLAASFNSQHQAGFDLQGVAGGAFFNVAAPVVGVNSNNTGNATIGAVISNAGALTTSDYSLRYDGSNYTVTRLSDNSTTTFASFPQTIDGVTLNLASGAAAAGDNFLIRPTANGASGIGVALTDPAKIAAAGATGAVGDNSNALALAALQTSKTLGNGSASYADSYAQLVSQIGNKTREVQSTSAAADSLLSQATTAQQNLSGVNLDEEAANLLRYQQAYQAAGKVMQIASQLFDVLLSLGR